MKFFILLGGSLGFLAAFSSALHAGSEIGFALRDGAIGCLCGALLLRGFHFVMMSCIRSLAVERARANAGSNTAKTSTNGSH
jgi:hypothetical protein